MRCLALAGVAVLVLSSRAPGGDSSNRSAQDQGAGIWTGVERVVAVGDVHGDYDQLAAVLRSAGLIDEQSNWTGGKTHLVQNGDVLDRGPDSRKAMDLLMRLEKQAAEAGGYVHALIGNHEAMNVYGDLRYVSPGEFAAFRDENSEKSREAALAKERPADRAHWEAQHPLGYFEHRQQFSPSGTYGKWIASHDAVIKINDSLFLHGGISPKYVSTKIRDINQRRALESAARDLVVARFDWSAVAGALEHALLSIADCGLRIEDCQFIPCRNPPQSAIRNPQCYLLCHERLKRP